MITNTMARPPHRGAVTHHHDQSMTLHNFSTMNAIPSSPKNPIPLLLLLLEDEFPMSIFSFCYTILNLVPDQTSFVWDELDQC